MNEIPERRSAMPELIPFVGSWRVVPDFRDVTQRLGIAVAANRCARLAVALEQYRRKNGGFPARLQDVVPQGGDLDVLDPFTGQPLRYMRTDAGYLLYSVGRDGQDDGGKVSPQQVNGRVFGTGPIPDVGVRVVRP